MLCTERSGPTQHIGILLPISQSPLHLTMVLREPFRGLEGLLSRNCAVRPAIRTEEQLRQKGTVGS